MKLKIIIIAAIILVGFGLRFKNYATVPVAGDSLDEYSFSWVGLSLIGLGVPVGASGVGGYDNNIYRYVNVDRVYQTDKYASPTKINYPWMDHPPLLGLVTGSYAYLSGARTFEDSALRIIRKPMVFLGTLALILVIILAYDFFGYWPAAISGLIYATSPLVVVSSRMVQAENLLIIWFLLTLLAIKKEKWLWVGIFTSLAFWTKFSAVAILLVALFSIRKPKTKNFILGLMPGMILLLVYYGVYGIETFWTVNVANTNREYAIGTNVLFDLITKTRITHVKFLTDGWILAAWIAFFANRKFNLLHAFIVSYLATYILFGNYPHGWYATPFWPILFIFLGKFIYEGSGTLLSVLPLGVGLNKFTNLQIWRWGMFGILTTIVFAKNKKRVRTISYILFGLAILTNAYWVYKLDVSMWYKI